MKRLNPMIGALLGAACLFFAGCRTSQENEDNKKPSPTIVLSENESEFAEAADRYAAKVLSAIRDNDYELFHSLVPDAYKKEQTPEKFAEMRGRLIGTKGKIAGFKYVDSLEMPPRQIRLWKVSTEVEVAPSKGEAHMLRRDLLFRFFVASENGKLAVYAFGF